VTFINGRLSVELPPPARQNPVVKQSILAVLLAAIFFGGSAGRLAAQGTAFFYQGRLSDTGTLANTNYDFRFAIYNAETNGTPASVLITNSAVPVSNGLFTVTLDFGSGVFTGSDAWLDIAVRAAGTASFTPLSPRQPILPVPYAIFAGSASNLVGGLSTTQLVGTLPASAFAGYTNSVSLTNANNQFQGAFAGSFSGAFNGVFAGNGLALTNFDGAHVTTGTVADARLSANVALLNTNQTFTGSNIFTGNDTFNGVNTFSNFNNSFSGSFYGNGLVGWNATNGSLTAVRDHGYMLTGPQLITVTLPSSPLTNGDIVRVSGAGAGGWLVQVNSGQSIFGNFASYKNCLLVPATTNNDWRCLASSADGTRMYAGGNFNGGVYFSTDSGHTWNPTGASVTGGWFSIACSSDGTKVFVGAYGGYILMSSNGGLTWSTISDNSNRNWTAIACTADGSKFFAAVSGGLIYQWSAGSLAVYNATSANWSAVACSSDATVVAAAHGNSILTTRGSATISGNCSALVISADGSKIAAAYNGGIVASANSGTNWTVTSAPAANWSCLAGSSDCTRLVAGVSNGLFYASANFGTTWTPISTVSQIWSGVDISSDGSKFAATVRNSGGVLGGIYYASTSTLPNTTATNTICGSQGSAVELQYIGNNQFMPVSSSGILWAN
jgi:hypothetical protein